MSLLKINNLHVEVVGHEILKGINLSVNTGEVHSIMGPNGRKEHARAGIVTARILSRNGGRNQIQRQRPSCDEARRSRLRRHLHGLPISG